MDSGSQKPIKDQLELAIERPQSLDRNHALGGRSFYFFDFDDNVVFLPTPLYLFHKIHGTEKQISTREFAEIQHQVGKTGHWIDFEIRHDPRTGSFRRFRHREMNLVERLLLKKQPLHEDLLSVISKPSQDWKGPSWNFFWHAVHNSRPLSIITARGHQPKTIKEAISLLTQQNHLSRHPNYLSIFPVSHSQTRTQLGDLDHAWHTAKLKQEAIKFSVREAFRVYGVNHAHRFGMSDDDPVNIRMIVQVMRELKKEYPFNSFFVIDTQGGRLAKQEVFADGVKATEVFETAQLKLF